MPRPRWMKLPAERRHEMADAVLSEVAEVGFAQASVNRVLRAAGQSKGALYYYFDDRADLLSTVLGEVASRIQPDLIGPLLVTTTPAQFWEAIHQRYLAGLGWLVAHPRLRRIARWAVSESSGPGALPPELSAFPRRVTALTEQVLHHGQKIGAVRTDLDPNFLLHLTVSLLFALDTWALRQDDLDAEAAADRLIDLCRRSLGCAD